MPWKDCDVVRTGPAEEGTIFIALKAKDGSFNAWFKAVDLREKEMLAVALTAICTGNSVTALLTSFTQYSTINRLYVHA